MKPREISPKQDIAYLVLEEVYDKLPRESLIALLVIKDKYIQDLRTLLRFPEVVNEEVKETEDKPMQKLNRSSFRTLGIELSRRSKMKDKFQLPQVKNPPTKTVKT